MADQRKLGTTPCPIAVRAAIAEAYREGYMLALAEIETCLYSGGSVTDLVRSGMATTLERVRDEAEAQAFEAGRRDA